MKRILSVLCALILTMSLFAGCSNNTGEDGEIIDSSSAPAKVYSLDEAFNAVKDAYGEDYLPSMDLDETFLSETMGLDMENIEEFKAQGPMISAHVDTFVAVKAKPDTADTVSQEMDNYRNDLYDNSINYPMNMPKIAASEVVTHGDYVFFLMLGKINDDANATEADLEKFYAEQTAIGKDALKKYFEE